MDAKTPKPRTPAEISGAIRERAEMLWKRNQGMDDKSVSNAEDISRIDELLTELDAAIASDQLTASLEARKS